MTPIADMVAQMLAAGVGHDVIVLAIRTAEATAVRGIPPDKVDMSAERRRAYDRERKRAVRGIPPENPQNSADTQTPLILTSSPDTQNSKKEGKKERGHRKLLADIPPDWKPPDRAFEIARELRVSIPEIEPRFRDYLASSGRRYADYDAGFCNFVRNTPKFNGGPNGHRPAKASLASAADDLIARAEEREREDGPGTPRRPV